MSISFSFIIIFFYFFFAGHTDGRWDISVMSASIMICICQAIYKKRLFSIVVFFISLSLSVKFFFGDVTKKKRKMENDFQSGGCWPVSLRRCLYLVRIGRHIENHSLKRDIFLFFVLLIFFKRTLSHWDGATPGIKGKRQEPNDINGLWLRNEIESSLSLSFLFPTLSSIKDFRGRDIIFSF